MNLVRYLKQKAAFIGSFIGVAGMATFGQWIGTASLGDPVLDHWVSGYVFYRGTNIAVSLVLFLFCLWLVYICRGVFMAARSFRYHPCKPHKCLVMLLTLPNIKPPRTALPWTLTTKDKNTGEDIVRTLSGKSLSKEEIEPLNRLQWNWQQILRALVPHKNSLKEVRLIGSPDKDNKDGTGSRFFAQEAEQLIKTYFPNIRIIIEQHAIDFEDFNAMVTVIGDTIKELKRHYSEDDIIIDITGGQKTASIAAATVTLNSQMHFQYVRTLPYGSIKLEDDVMSYDVRVLSPLSGEG